MSKLGDFLKGFGRKKKEERLFCSAVVVAAGTSMRMQRDKISADIGGAPLIAHSLAAINSCACIDEIVVVTRSERIVELSRICKEYNIDKVSKVVCGGNTRTHSALAGVMEINPKAQLVAIHDGARPFVTPDIVEKTVEQAAKYKAACPAVPVKDTIKIRDGNVVKKTLNRATAVAVQTPQVFETDLIKGALTSAINNGAAITDDCSAVERLGVEVWLTEGSDENIKITTPTDLLLAEAILAKRGGAICG